MQTITYFAFSLFLQRPSSFVDPSAATPPHHQIGMAVDLPASSSGFDPKRRRSSGFRPPTFQSPAPTNKVR